jgi:Zn-dependent protease
MNLDGHLAALISNVTTWVLPVIFAATFHEAAHGFVALRFGDDTALRAGRISLNPLNHIDLFGTILLPALLLMTSGFMFGYAKPVPVNFGRLRPARLGMILVALAGPGMNVLMALISSLLLFAVGFAPAAAQRWLGLNLAHLIVLNCVLCVFNMLPLPPLDGGRVAVGILPRFLAWPLARLEPYGMLILMGLFAIGYISARADLNINPLGWLILGPANLLIRLVLAVTGQGG